MTFAWYGHLKYKTRALWIVILASWGIAFLEYMLQVPANRWGNAVYSATQLKIIQEVITLIVFVGFAMMYLGEKLRWNHIAAFGQGEKLTYPLARWLLLPLLISLTLFVLQFVGQRRKSTTSPLQPQPDHN